MCLNVRVRFRRRKGSVAEEQSWCRDVLGEVGIAIVRKITTVLRAGVQPCRNSFIICPQLSMGFGTSGSMHVPLCLNAFILL